MPNDKSALLGQLKIDRNCTPEPTWKGYLNTAVLLFAGFAGFGGIIYAMHYEAQKQRAVSDLQTICLKNGYPANEVKRQEVFCIRRVDNTDEVKSAKELK